MPTNEPIDLPSLGQPSIAKDAVARAIEHVPAYQAHLAHTTSPDDWDALPFTDKKSYLLKHEYRDLLADNYTDTFAVFSSSGSSGRAFYWPQLKDGQHAHGERLKQLLEVSFKIHQRPTMAIVGLALGSWIGGEHFSWALKNLAASTTYPFSVFSPGNQHDEIIHMIHSTQQFTEQIILFVCPSAIGHLRLRAEQQGQPLPLHKLRFIVLGEPFPESMRIQLHAEAKLAPDEINMLSIFGSADTGVIGCESPASAVIRGLCERSPELANALGFSNVVPHLFHHLDPSSYLESVDGELCVTKWQGIPLLRYNLHDSARLLKWSSIVETTIAICGDAHPAIETLRHSATRLPDILAITGRSDSCLLLCGTNLTEAMLDTTLRSQQLAPWLTGNYQARTSLSQTRQRLELTLECHQLDENTRATIYPLIINGLGQVQPEFKDDWEKIYHRWDDAPELSILDLKCVPWPQLSENDQIKQRGIQA